MACGITIYKSQGLTLDHAVIEFGHTDFSAGLTFVAVSQVKSLNGLAFCSRFDISRLQKPTESEMMKMLRLDHERCSALGFHLNTYGMNLGDYIFNP